MVNRAPMVATFACAILISVAAGDNTAGLTKATEYSAAPEQQSNLLLSVGLESGDTLLEFNNVSSALRLSNGDIVIANSGTSQLRWFDRAGKFVRTLGRRGKGPGEFGRSIFIYPIAADTIVVYDINNRRYHYIDRSGRFTRIDSAGSPQRLAWVYDRTIIDYTPIGANVQRIRTVAAGIPFRDGEIVRRAIPDESGALWIRSTPATWTAYGEGGRVIAVATLPPTFQPFHISDSLVLGRDRDSLGVDRVQLRRFVRVAPRTSTNANTVSRPLYDSQAEREEKKEILAVVKAELRNLVTAQEYHYSVQRTYAQNIRALRFVPAQAIVDVLQADERGYFMVARHDSMRTICVFASGLDWPHSNVECG